MYVETKTLAPAVRQALEGVGYGSRDIELVPSFNDVNVFVAGGDGKRGFALLVNLDTGERKTLSGSWGGANMFNRDNVVDLSDEKVPLPDHGCLIKGTTGYPRTFATIYLRPAAMGRFLPPAARETEALTDADQQALYCFAAIKGGEYRRDEMRRRAVEARTVDGLVERGYLKRARNGATQVTTLGKNARDRSVR